MIDGRAMAIEASELKLRALRMAAMRADRFEIAIVLHAAARAEQRALGSLSDPPLEAIVGSLIEQCGCWIHAEAPRWAAMAWSKIVALEARAGPGFLRELRSRISSEYADQQERWLAEVSRIPRFTRVMKRGTFAPSSKREARLVRPEVERIARVFPGDIHLWYALYRIEGVAGRDEAEVGMIGRAHRLDPTDEPIAALYLAVLASMPRQQLIYEREVENYQDKISLMGFQLLVMYSLLVLGLARKVGRSQHYLDLAERAIAEAELRTDKVDYLVPELKCANWVLGELRGGRSATVADLLRTGLVGDLPVNSARLEDDALAFVSARALPALRDQSKAFAPLAA